MEETNVRPVYRTASGFQLAEEDLNGDVYVAGAEGEKEEAIATNFVVFRKGMPRAEIPMSRIRFSAQQAVDFVLDQIAYLRTFNIPHRADLAYIRFLAAREGLISPSFNPSDYNVKYNDAREMDPVIPYDDDDDALAASVLTAERKAYLRRNFADMVCTVAFMFRARGHHFLEGFEEQYRKIWVRCLHSNDDLKVPWSLIATVGLHAIIPIHLDNFWIDSAKNARVAGALIKRLDVAPAGSAAPLVVKKGIEDIKMIFPKIDMRLPEAFRILNEEIDAVNQSRWRGSVNARYYGVERYRPNEAALGAIAAVVVGIYKELAETSPLVASQALQRVASQAPVTGAVLGQAAIRAVRDERNSLVYTFET